MWVFLSQCVKRGFCDWNATAPFVTALVCVVVDIAALCFSNRHIGITRDILYFFSLIWRGATIRTNIRYLHVCLSVDRVSLHTSTQSPSVFGSVQNEKVHMASYWTTCSATKKLHHFHFTPLKKYLVDARRTKKKSENRARHRNSLLDYLKVS